eukprot:TRINITY_DN13336_c0_g1_i1.p1 TRINITY_DN13336_c0_g1~~TRINITY_DN13336_c0_g1_i1.p1  ORF type:complete len:257 (+),score=84.38 TRINITY_DN13336_c0_g1_i1:64-834(+)
MCIRDRSTWGGLKFRNEDEIFLLNGGSTYRKAIGNVTQATELTFEYELKSPEEIAQQGINIESAKEIPMQAQINFTSLKGDRVLRVITQFQQTTKEQHLAEQDADIRLLGARANYLSSNTAIHGRLDEARGKAMAWNGYINSVGSRKQDKDTLQELAEHESQARKIIMSIDQLELRNAKKKAGPALQKKSILKAAPPLARGFIGEPILEESKMDVSTSKLRASSRERELVFSEDEIQANLYDQAAKKSKKKPAPKK